MSGWIKLHRSILKSEIWREEPFTKAQAWIDLLLMASHCDGARVYYHGEAVNLSRGELVTSERILTVRWKWSRKKVCGFLLRLEQGEMVALKRDHRKTHVSITNYDTYQSSGATEGTSKEPVKSQSGASEEPHIKNDKNLKNEKNITPPTPLKGGTRKRGDPKYREFKEEDFEFPKRWGPKAKAALGSWVEFKHRAGHPITLFSYQAQVKSFENDPEQFAKLVERAIKKAWRGLNEELPLGPRQSVAPGQKVAPRAPTVIPSNPPPELKSRERTPAEKELHDKLMAERGFKKLGLAMAQEV